MNFKILLFIGSIFISMFSGAQIVYYQETCQCGVTGAGFSTAQGNGAGDFSIFIEPGSTIKKAILFGVHFGDNNVPKVPALIQLNSMNLIFSDQNALNINFDAFGNPYGKNISLHGIELTNILNPSTNNYHITVPDQSGSCGECQFNCFYLYVLYENPSFGQNITSYVLLNNQNEAASNQYELPILNQISNSSPIGFAVYLDRMNTLNAYDGSRLYFNNGSIINTGLMKGSDNVNPSWIGAGVKGHYYFQNNSLFGLDDDTPDNVVGGTDGLLDVSGYVHPDGSLKWKLNWEIQTGIYHYNIYNGFFIEHSTPCDTFSVSVPFDTTICRGESLQLNVTGGSQYEWQPASDLSCSNCPNPVFTGDSTQLYTVRIWNNDSCSVVRPVKIKVQSCVGLEEQFIEESFTIYPNPTSGLIQLQSKESKNQELCIEVFDLLGKQKHTESILFQQDYWMNLRLSPGTYLLKVTSPQNEFFTKRIVVE